MDKQRYSDYSRDLEKACNCIDLKKSVRTSRKGIVAFRDWMVLLRQAFISGEQWLSIPKAMVFWLSLT